LSALRAWGVTFLAAISANQGAPAWLPDPTVLFTVAGLGGIVVSIAGNETAELWGRARRDRRDEYRRRFVAAHRMERPTKVTAGILERTRRWREMD
jgi:hypothetical protein